MSLPAAPTEQDLMAHADGLLDPPRRAEVDSWLLKNPEAAAEVASWERQNEAIRTLFGHVGREGVPARLSADRISAAPRFGWGQMAAAAIVLIGLGGGLGWAGRTWLAPSEPVNRSLIAAAVTAHGLYVAEQRHAVEVAAAEEEHLVSWLSNRIESPFVAPDLAGLGFGLVGGRLLPPTPGVESGPAAQLMYEDEAGQRITVYLTGHVEGEEAVRQFVDMGGVDAFYWGNEAITCTVVGDLPEERMQELARQVYAELTAGMDLPRYEG